jgi:MFS family permease
MSSKEVLQQNTKYHFIEGVLYISTNALISPQTVMPALIQRLGGNDILIGSWPIVVYLALFVPQLFSAYYSSGSQFRKPAVIRRGFIQRMNILILAIAIALFGSSMTSLALFLLFLIFISNQVASGVTSPIWMDFVAKTTPPQSRGKLLGYRTSIGAAIGLFNGFILTALLTTIAYPYNYAAAFGLAFLYQMASLVAQQKVVEDEPSIPLQPVHVSDMLSKIKSIYSTNHLFRKFLIASGLLTISFSSVAFFTVAALQKFHLQESEVGLFTVLMIVGQIVSGVVLGWLADLKGTKLALILCGGSLVVAIVLSLIAPTVNWYYWVFIFMGINTGAEIFMRYNFAVECAPEQDRAMYVGLMNAWLAPFYILTPFAGWLSASYGYNSVFILSLVFGLFGILLLSKLPEPKVSKLAISSK